MPIIHITGPAKSGKSLMANNLRNNQINQGKSALLVDDSQNGEPRYLLEKIVAGASLDRPMQAKDVPWKTDPLVIVVGDKISALDEFEELVPGFKKMFEPVKKMAMSA